jgi:DNA primase
MPVKWREVNGRLSNERFHLGNAVARVKRGGDPLAPILTSSGDLVRALTVLGAIFEREARARR